MYTIGMSPVLFQSDTPLQLALVDTLGLLTGLISDPSCAIYDTNVPPIRHIIHRPCEHHTRSALS